MSIIGAENASHLPLRSAEGVTSFFRPWLSFGGVKSQNEFAMKPLSCNKESVHDVEISKFVSQKPMFWSSKCILEAEERPETTT